MEYSFAPMEGITTRIYRVLHREMFPGTVKYYAPFIAPDVSGRYKDSQLRDILPENNPGIRLIPQLMANNANAFYIASQSFRELGYAEVNLNAGCPSGTVAAKHKGSGMLADLRSLDNFLADVFSLCDMDISVKTRMGMESVDEFAAILEVYNKYPIKQLIIHARDRKGMYKSTPDMEAFAHAASLSRAPVTYNGNIFCADDVHRLLSLAPDTKRIMLGRGAVTNPALIRQLNGGAPASNDELRAFHDRYLDKLLDSGYGEHNSMARLKELWYYMIYMYPGSERLYKALNRSRTIADYRAAANAIFASGLFDENAVFGG